MLKAFPLHFLLRDAFKIAEEDLRLRGPGEVLGKRQSGLPDLKCLEWATHGPWLEAARNPVEHVDYLLLSTDTSSDLLSQLYPEAAVGRDRSLTTIYTTARYTLVGVPAGFVPDTVAQDEAGTDGSTESGAAGEGGQAGLEVEVQR